jgi:hypothetical protein
MANSFINVGAIGVGQAGTNIAQTYMQVTGGNTEFLCSINLSQDDLDQATLVPSTNRLHLDDNMRGAGKKRSVSITYASEKKNEIINFLVTKYHKACNVIFVFFSTSGGTGSGSGPFITALLESDVLADAKPNRCVIMGVPLIGDLKEGKDLLVNTQDCLDEINKMAVRKMARFLPIFNQSKVDIKDDISKWKMINDEAVRLINRYLFVRYPSKYQNLDTEDRFVLLSTPGLHSLLTFNPEDPTTIQSPFLLPNIPNGVSVQRMGCELPKDYSSKRFDLIKALKANVTEPNFIGLYEDAPSSIEGGISAPPIPIAHFAGFNNLPSFSQLYKDQIDKLKSIEKAGLEADKDGTGFDNVDENIDEITEQNKMQRAKDPDEILRELMS